MLFQLMVILKRYLIFKQKLLNASKLNIIKLWILFVVNILNQKIKKSKIIKTIQKTIVKTYWKTLEINSLYI
jgi:hypothetical protein